ncbi:MAG: type I restriction endonuclease subunit R [Planctomycetota bacterium]|jgi:type I restriction enzyme R subunit
MTHIAESDLEDASLSWLDELGYQVLYGPDIAPSDDDEPSRERSSYSDVLLLDRFRDALARINPWLDDDSIGEISRRLMRSESASLIVNNRAFHKWLVDGFPVQRKTKDGHKWKTVKLVDYKNPEKNDWLAVNQFTVLGSKPPARIPDIVVFINGLPLAVIELKNPTDPQADIWKSFSQIQTYKKEIEGLFVFNEALVISDGLNAKIGSISADKERFMPWRTIEGEDLAPKTMLELEVLIKGFFEKKRLLDYLQHFIVFEDDGSNIIKKMAGYHQFHAVNEAVGSTIIASSKKGDKRGGVIWHTQGAGKSITMAFYAGKLILQSALENPTIVVLTDRLDLDDQLFGTFSRCQDLLRQAPVQVESRADLRERLKVASGGVVFTTIQKFLPEEKGDEFPMLSDRRNIVVIADEAHRSQYDFIDGFARHMRDALPNATFIGFTGTPIETQDKNTKAVFGDYVSIYDIERAVGDEFTVHIYYEARLAKLEISEKERPHIDPEFEEVTEKEEEDVRTRLKKKWAALEKIVGAQKRIELIAKDVVDHFEKRLEIMEGKGMIVCMSRRICVELYDALIKLRPHWHGDDDLEGSLKVVMTGSASDPVEWQKHIRNKKRREKLAKRYKVPEDPFKIVIVRDMWLTGFDAPCLHTMYIDKPMHSHTLMQAIARVNRVFKDKPGGLVVDYIGIADALRRAMAAYTESGGQGDMKLDQDQAVAILLEKYEICRGMFHGFDWSDWTSAKPVERLRLLPAAQEHILAQENGKERLLSAVGDLSKAFALAVPHEKALEIRDDVGFFQAVKAAIFKTTTASSGLDVGVDLAIKQIVSKAIVSDQVIDIFSAAGLKRPDISILSEEFMAEVRKMPHRNLAIETLKKLLSEEIRTRTKKNLIQSKKFSQMLDEALSKYKRKAITSAEVIDALIQLAKKMRESYKRGEGLELTEDEIAFYDALEVNDSAVKILGDKVLRNIAIELVDTVKKNVTIDWARKESVRARLRVMIKRVLGKHGYPPDKQEKATMTVLQQAELIAQDWVAA